MKIKIKSVLCKIIVIGGLSGCATSATKSALAPDDAVSKSEIEEVKDIKLTSTALSEDLEMIPVEVNEKVEMWIKYFQTRGRPHMERYLARSTRYEALMKKVLRDNKLPEDLFYIALIESGFSSNAFSHASAVGYWQFIRGTGKRYNLQINKIVDDRRDPVLATQAAAAYFKALHDIFDSWYLSMAAYNVGEGRVIRAVKKYRTKDFWELSRAKRALPAETDNYVPKYVAAKLIAKNPDKYGFDGIDYMTPIEFDHIKFDKPMNLRVLSEKMNVNYEDFKDLNPKYKGEIAPLENGFLELRIPPGMSVAAQTASTESVASEIDFVPDQNETQVYRVARGDTFSNIARKFKTNIAYLREINDFPRKKKLKLGQKIFVPDRTPLKEKRSEPKVAAKQPVKVEEGSQPSVKNYTYIVRKGDSLASIASKYKVSIQDLVKVNNLGRKTKIKAGARLTLPQNAVFADKNAVRENKNQKIKIASDVKNYKIKMKKAKHAKN
ncbi:MAG: LysM peptidoglycan-binding domain-containing protein [Moraxellaceae bacterium]|nr:LysM peptidoglycan-binding domain-containing protein [Pseudobdellovibrionaceae bacterium]